MHRPRDLVTAYRRSLQEHGYQADPAQEHAIGYLEELRQRLARESRGRRGWLRRLVGRRPGGADAARGVYLWGGVGRGKTYLMDLFHSHAGVPVRREHFHRFMKEVHARLHELRDLSDPLVRVAEGMRGDAVALCLDELYVSDIADAMILAGLFDAFVQQGVVLVCTSNTPPGGLYRDGLQRARFLPAIALLERHTRVVNVDGGIDYRLRALEKAPLYVESEATDSEARMQERFTTIAGTPGAADALLAVEGTLPHYQIILTRERGLDEIEVQVEVTPDVFGDTIGALEALNNRLVRAVDQVVGLRVAVRLVAPHTIQRSEGKAKRVIDRRSL